MCSYQRIFWSVLVLGLLFVVGQGIACNVGVPGNNDPENAGDSGIILDAPTHAEHTSDELPKPEPTTEPIRDVLPAEEPIIEQIAQDTLLSEPTIDAGTAEPIVPDQAQLPDLSEPDLTTPEPMIEPVPETSPQESVSIPEQTTTPDYTKQGPLKSKTASTIKYNMPATTGCSGSLCTVSIYVTYPDAPGTGNYRPPYPLAIFSNGFLLGADRYPSYANMLATWGYVALRWDTNGENLLSNVTHKALGAFVVELINWADAQNKNASSPLHSLIRTDKVFVIGHSRGGKINVLAAQNDTRIAGIFGIDPVNASPRSGTDYPSALTNMSKTNAPLAVTGADKGGQGLQPCAPTNDNYAKFYDAASSPAWELLLLETGHMQFLDSRTGCIPCWPCTNGSTPDATVRQLTQTAMIAWAEKTIRNADISLYTTGKWIQEQISKKLAKSRTK
jgi:pimeloyl-ACP methyl ester carboxylesterase